MDAAKNLKIARQPNVHRPSGFVHAAKNILTFCLICTLVAGLLGCTPKRNDLDDVTREEAAFAVSVARRCLDGELTREKAHMLLQAVYDELDDHKSSTSPGYRQGVLDVTVVVLNMKLSITYDDEQDMQSCLSKEIRTLEGWCDK